MSPPPSASLSSPPQRYSNRRWSSESGARRATSSRPAPGSDNGPHDPARPALRKRGPLIDGGRRASWRPLQLVDRAHFRCARLRPLRLALLLSPLAVGRPADSNRLVVELALGRPISAPKPFCSRPPRTALGHSFVVSWPCPVAELAGRGHFRLLSAAAASQGGRARMRRRTLPASYKRQQQSPASRPTKSAPLFVCHRRPAGRPPNRVGPEVFADQPAGHTERIRAAADDNTKPHH
jgi:hypothetical protein